MIGKDFIEKAKEIFSFLTSNYGYDLANENIESDELMYKSKNRAIKINYEWHDQFIWITIFRIQNTTDKLSDIGDADNVLYLTNLIKYYNRNYDESVLQVESLYSYENSLKKSALLLKECGEGILKGDKWVSNSDRNKYL